MEAEAEELPVSDFIRKDCSSLSTDEDGDSLYAEKFIPLIQENMSMD
jgi:hypothetical protein